MSTNDDRKSMPRQIAAGPVWVRPNSSSPFLAVAYCQVVNGVEIEYWALLRGQKLNPGTSTWTSRQFKTPDNAPEGAPNPSRAQFIAWAQSCMTTSHGSLPALDYIMYEASSLD